MRTFALTALAMLAFAANSLLCRAALGEDLIDAASFATLRVLSGAFLLAIMASRAVGRAAPQAAARPDWPAIIGLFVYLTAFSFAYLSLPAGSGALVLFAAVQLTMLGAALYGGERFTLPAWFGFALAVAGLVYLLSPGFSAPPLGGSLLMALAGIAWGVYSLRGRGNRDALQSTSRNFVLAAPLVMAVNLLFVHDAHWSIGGVALAVLSGTLASALGYVVWYAALRGLSAMSAATVQLSVPVIAAAGGVLLLAEALSLRLVLASIAVLGGIAITLMQRRAATSA